MIFLRAFLILSIALAAGGWRKGAPAAPPAVGWSQFVIGGGGQVTNIDWQTSSSPFLITTDTGGAYKYNVATSTWGQLISTNSLPSALWSTGTANFMNGAYDLTSAPSDATICYLGYTPNNGGENTAYVLKSTNCNATPSAITWTNLTGWGAACTSSCVWGSNIFAYKATGRKIQVDPNNANVVIVTTPNSGQFVTTDGGTTFAALNNVTASAGGYPATGVAFDNSGAHNCGGGSNQTCKVWVCTHGDGCWRSTTGSTGTFSKQTSGTGPTHVKRAKLGIDGSYYACEIDGSGNSTKLWRFTTTWTDITPAGGTGQCDNVVPSPFDATKLVIGGGSGSLFWATSVNTTPSWTGGTSAPTRASSDVPWLIVPPSPAPQDFLAAADMIEDPATQGKYWTASGVGVWYTTQSPGTGSVSYVGLTGGIEQLVINQIKSPVGGNPIVAAWDRPTWYMNNVSSYKTGYGPNYDQSIEMGWSIDCSQATPTFCVQFNIWTAYNSSYSADGGQTWTAFANFPAIDLNTYIGGYIAVSDPGSSTAKIAFAVSNDGDVYRTVNNGTSAWTRVDAPTVFGHGAPNAGGGVITGWGHNGRADRQSMCADSAGGGIFYIYNSNDVGDGGGFYKTTDTFTTATRMLTPFSGGANQGGLVNQMECVPGKTGYVFYSGGQASSSLFMTKDGGTNWPSTTTPAAITGPGCTPTDVFRVSAGKTKVGNDFPSIYIVATCVTFGVWRSDNTQAEWNAGTAITWTGLGLPNGYMDEISALAGDANTYGAVYIGGKGISTFKYTP